MIKFARKLTVTAIALATTIFLAVMAYATTTYFTVGGKIVTCTLDVSSTTAVGITEIAASDSLISVSLYGQYYANGTTTIKNVSNGNGGPYSIITTSISNGNPVSGYGQWVSIRSVNTASYDGYSESKEWYW